MNGRYAVVERMATLAKQSVHAVPYEGHWATKLSHVDNPVSTHRTQADAVEHSIMLARMMGTEILSNVVDGGERILMD